jgi:CDP-diacylglycerol--serine O-phosphatidyltransferase
MLLLVGAFVFVSSDPPIVLFGLFVVYGLSGWAIMFWRWRRARELTRLRQEGLEERETAIAPTFTAPHTYQLPESDAEADDADHRSPPLEKPRGPHGS